MKNPDGQKSATSEPNLGHLHRVVIAFQVNSFIACFNVEKCSHGTHIFIGEVNPHQLK